MCSIIQRLGPLCLVLLCFAAVPLAALANPASVAPGWNNEKIDWRDYDHGVAEAARTGKPIIVVAHTTWCPHCGKYKLVFQDAAVVAASKQFVMILLDRDLETALNKQLGPNQTVFVPRTLFLASNATLRADMTGSNKGYPNWIDNSGPKELLRLMAAATKP